MTDTSTADTDTSDTSETTEKPDTGNEQPDLNAEVEKWKSQARKHEERAKANAQAVKELDQLKQASMSELEKSVATARTEARMEAMREFGGKLAAAEVRAAAAGRLSDEQVATLLEVTNLAAFVDDEGEVDRAKVSKFVDGIAPAEQANRSNGFPDLGQGARGTAGKGDMNSLIRRGLGRS